MCYVVLRGVGLIAEGATSGRCVTMNYVVLREVTHCLTLCHVVLRGDGLIAERLKGYY